MNRYYKNLNTKIIIKEELREINMGSWDALTMNERYAINEDYAIEWHKHLSDLPYPDGECAQDDCTKYRRHKETTIRECSNSNLWRYNCNTFM